LAARVGLPRDNYKHRYWSFWFISGVSKEKFFGVAAIWAFAEWKIQILADNAFDVESA
jgi:hypothetical protein